MTGEIQRGLPVPSAEPEALAEGAFLELVFGADEPRSARLAVGGGVPSTIPSHTPLLTRH